MDSIETSLWAFMHAACMVCMRSPSAPVNRSQIRTGVLPPVANVPDPEQAVSPPVSAAAPPSAAVPLRTDLRDSLLGDEVGGVCEPGPGPWAGGR